MTEDKFQSTHRVSDATALKRLILSQLKFQSTHRVSDATKNGLDLVRSCEISIHAPRERCDFNLVITVKIDIISIHAPRERCDQGTQYADNGGFAFQSTHRVSDATTLTH